MFPIIQSLNAHSPHIDSLVSNKPEDKHDDVWNYIFHDRSSKRILIRLVSRTAPSVIQGAKPIKEVYSHHDNHRVNDRSEPLNDLIHKYISSITLLSKIGAILVQAKYLVKEKKTFQNQDPCLNYPRNLLRNEIQ